MIALVIPAVIAIGKNAALMPWRWGKPKLIKGTAHSRDLPLASRLWEISEELTGEKFEL